MDFIEDAQNHPDRIDNVRLEPLEALRTTGMCKIELHDDCIANLPKTTVGCLCDCHSSELMPDLLSTRTQRNWGTDHVYLENISVAIFWENVTGKKTVSDDDLANLHFFIQTVLEDRTND